jgi:Rod binding protein
MTAQTATTSPQGVSRTNREISVLNTRKIDSSPKTWGDVLNGAVDARRPADSGTLSSKRLTDAQKLQMHAGLNGRLHVPTTSQTISNRLMRDKPGSPEPLSKVADPINEAIDPKSPDSFKQTAQTLVNQFFMGTMLKQMRQSPFKDETFSGGRAGEAYSSLFDQHVAEHAGNKVAKGLVESMVRQYQQKPSSVPVIRHEPALAVTA